jgi:hypothetical protein
MFDRRFYRIEYIHVGSFSIPVAIDDLIYGHPNGSAPVSYCVVFIFVSVNHSA